MRLKANCAGEYKRRHQQLWPELGILLKDAGIGNYTIFLDEETNTLFAYQEVEAGSGSQSLGDHEIVRKWWAYMADLMDTNADKSPVSVSLIEVFHLA